MNVRYRVTLTQYERNELRALLSGGKSPARKLKRAQILLAADAGVSDEDIALSDTAACCAAAGFVLSKNAALSVLKNYNRTGMCHARCSGRLRAQQIKRLRATATLLSGNKAGEALAAWLLAQNCDSVQGTRSSACWLSAAGHLAVA